MTPPLSAPAGQNAASASAVNVPRIATRARGDAKRGGGYQRPTGSRTNFEVWSWFFMRISGVLLLFLAVYHLVWWNLFIGVEHLDAELVRERWRNPFWRFFNAALLVFSMLHGLNGLRYSIVDYVRRPGPQLAVKAVAYTLVLGALSVALFALFTFDPAVFATR